MPEASDSAAVFRLGLLRLVRALTVNLRFDSLCSNPMSTITMSAKLYASATLFPTMPRSKLNPKEYTSSLRIADLHSHLLWNYPKTKSAPNYCFRLQTPTAIDVWKQKPVFCIEL